MGTQNSRRKTTPFPNPAASKQPTFTRLDLSPVLDAAREIVREEIDAKLDEKLAAFLTELENTLRQAIPLAMPADDADGPRSDGEKFFRLPAVLELTGLKRSTLFRAVKAGEFPAPVELVGERPAGPGEKYGTRSLVGWRSSDIREWLQTRRVKEQG